MLKHTNKSPVGTSFHGTQVVTNVGRLKELFPNSYEEGNDGMDKCNYDFILEDEEGNIVTIYDWKEYRPIGDNEMIYFNIGGINQEVTERAKNTLLRML